jgi:tetratricopeptide (TPR) repeat protein
VEFSAPRNALRQTTDINQKVLLEHSTPIPPEITAELTPEEIEHIENEREALLYCLRSNVLRVVGDMQGAVPLLMQAYRTAPDNAVIRNQLADLLSGSARELRQRGQLEEASNQYQMILHLRPDEFWALFNLTELAMLAGNTEFAGQLVDQALQYYPDSGIMAALHGKYLFSMGQYTRAMDEMNRAIALMPEKEAIRNDYNLIRKEITRLQNNAPTDQKTP